MNEFRMVLKIIAAILTLAAMLVVAFGISDDYWKLSSLLWNIVAVCLWLREFVLVRLNND